MPNTKSAKKRVRQNVVRRLRNKVVKSVMKTEVKRLLSHINDNDAQAATTALPSTISALDKAVQKGVMHRNTAARKKSALYSKYNALMSLSD